MRRFFCLLLYLITLCSIVGCSGEIESTDVDTTVKQSTQQEEEQKEITYEILYKFVELYNSSADIDIIVEEEYIYEHRLNALDGAYGLRGTLGKYHFDIINYGVYEKDCVRINMYVDQVDDAISIFDTAALVLDSTISEQELEDVHNTMNGIDGRGFINDIDYYVTNNYNANNFELFIDCDNVDFFDKNNK